MLSAQQTSVAPAPLSASTKSTFTEAQLSHLRSKSAHGVAGSCHAVRYRLRSPLNLHSLREKFEHAVKLWQFQHGHDSEAERVPRIWMETVQGASDSAVAQRQRQAEMTRAVEVLDGPPCRAVLLQYQDRCADLIVVAHRAVLDFRALNAIAGSFFQTDSSKFPRGKVAIRFRGETPSAAEAGKELLLKANYCSRPDWGMGTERSDQGWNRITRRAQFNEGVDLASFVASVGMVLSRYSGQPSPAVAVLVPDPLALDESGAGEGIAVAPITLEESQTCGDLLQRTSGIFSQPVWYTSALAGTLANNCENRGEMLAGVYFVDQLEDGSSYPLPDEYLPCLAAPFPLTISCTRDKHQGFILNCWYRNKDFHELVASQFLASVVRIHNRLRSAPEASLRELDLLDDECRSEVVSLSQPYELPVGHERIERLFSRRAMEHPEKTALSCGEERLTYHEVEDHTNRMAQALRECGVREGDRVGVCLDRSAQLVEVLLAVLKAGAAYVPIDPAYPAERISYTINDAQIKVILAAKSFSGPDDVRVVEPRELLKMAPRWKPDPLPSLSESDAAYVIYTSGSTGRPKGVVIPHRNVLALLEATRDEFGLNANDTWTLFHSSAFDFSVWEIWGCLLTGGHLVIAPYWVTRNTEEFAELLAKERVTVLNQTPSAFAQLLDVDRNHPLTSSLRLVIFGGEPLEARMLLPWFDRHPEFECRMVNMFGITETTVHVTLETITRDHALNGSKSVGYAMQGWYYYVMDSQGRVLPPGVSGEIYVGGAGVALSYLNRPELTAQRFVPDPHTGKRMYRSGDKGRLRPDGRLEHLGRLDSQVKIRGFRIELNEIRSVLLETSGVHAAAVIVHQDNPNDAATTKLCAYVVLNNGHISDIRTHLGRVLPEYMVPAVIIELPSLPLTHNGKLDTSRLPNPAKHGYRSHESPARIGAKEGDPDTLAASLLGIWESVLGVPVGLDDNFFDLGGNSLFAMRIATAMRNQGLPQLPIRELYVKQTVRRLSAALQE